MRPILAIIPAFPVAFLLPTIIVAALVGLLFSARLKSAAPLVFAVGVGFVAWLWSRQPITLHSYGFFLVIGFFLSVWLACVEARRRGYDPNIILDLAMPLLLVSIVLCRILYFLVYPSQWRGMGEFLQIWNGGLSFHGAIVGALGTIAYFSWKRRVPFGTLCDLVSPGIFAGYAVGRLGCFFNGCCYGYPTDLPWAVRFHVEGSNDPNAFTLPSHPAQLYSTGLSLVLFGVMWWARKSPRFTRFSGQLTIFLLALYGLERAVVEFFRRGATAPLVPGFEWITRAQLASVVAWIVLGALYLVLSKRAANQRALANVNGSDAGIAEGEIMDTPAANAQVVQSEITNIADAERVKTPVLSGASARAAGENGENGLSARVVDRDGESGTDADFERAEVVGRDANGAAKTVTAPKVSSDRRR